MFNALRAVIVSLGLAGCVSEVVQTREQWLAVSEKTYPGLTPEQVIQAAEAVTKSIQPTSISFVHSSEGFQARQPFAYYMVFAWSAGFVIYDFKATQTAEGVRANLRISVRGQYENRDNIDQQNQFADSYRTFFGWLDYALGRSQSWKNCEQLNAEALTAGKNFDAQGVCTAQAIGGILPVEPKAEWLPKAQARR